jgi:hypothetical protein
VDFAAGYGLVFDDWQAWVVEGWLGRRKDGRLAASRCGLAVPRQNGKNAILEGVELFKMVALGRRILHTAHEVKTARKAFLRLCSFFENPRKWPELASLVASVRKTNGQEAIFLTNGGSVEFIARSKGSGRGFTVDDLVCDESQELSDDALAALYPTISAAPSGDPQLILTGTPPSESMVGEVFKRFRALGVLGKDQRFCWDEWSVTPDADLDDRANWAAVNPALGIRLGVDVIVDERAAMDDETFGRERLGIWDEDGMGRLYGVGNWERCFSAGSSIISGLTLGVAVSLDRSRSAVGSAGRNADAKTHLEPITAGTGTAWVVAECKRIQSKHGGTVVIDKGGPAGMLVLPLTEAGVDVTEMSTSDACDAAAGLYDAVQEQKVTHLNDADLNASVMAAQRRTVGDRWLLGRKDSGDITVIEAVQAAAWGVANAPNYAIEDSFY